MIKIMKLITVSKLSLESPSHEARNFQQKNAGAFFLI